MTFSALDSELTGPLFASVGMRAVFSDRAKLAAMLTVEAALARAEAAHGLVPKALATAIGRIAPGDLDIAKIGDDTATAGMPTIPFVKAVEAKLPAKLRADFHRGATSQDVLDTALVLQVADGLDLVAADLATIIAGLAKLARAHRRTPQVGRTYGQHAQPITFGYAVAVWLAGIAEVAADLPRLRERALTASLDGPVGTLPGLGGKAERVRASFAAELGLVSTAAPWHVLRARVAETGLWLALVIGALAKMATDVVHLSSTEVGEVSEAHAVGRGGSSALPHKRNPVSSTVILAAHGAAAGHVATLVNAMAAADQRPAGPWHTEWHALPQLFGLASGALREGRRLAEDLVVDKTRMRDNLDMTGGLLFAGAVSARLATQLGRDDAHRLVAKAADTVRETGVSLEEALAEESAIPQALWRTLAPAFDLTPAVDAAAAATDRILAATKPVARQIAPRKRRKR